jgi:hypothetical protein
MAGCFARHQRLDYRDVPITCLNLTTPSFVERIGDKAHLNDQTNDANWHSLFILPFTISPKKWAAGERPKSREENAH